MVGAAPGLTASELEGVSVPRRTAKDSEGHGESNVKADKQ